MRPPPFFSNVFRVFPWLSTCFEILGIHPGTGIHGDLVSTPITCLNSSATLYGLIQCLDDFTVPSGTYSTNALYDAAQPIGDEITAWNTVVATLLTVDGNCGSALLPSALKGIYTVTLFTEADGKSFCVLSEAKATEGHYTRGWGLMVVPATRAAVSRYIHISAPHPVNDQATPKRAVAVFKGTGAKSLFVSGRHRHASPEDSCQGPHHSMTDAAHDTVRLLCVFLRLKSNIPIRKSLSLLQTRQCSPGKPQMATVH
jgi:hypothetical protein